MEKQFFGMKLSKQNLWITFVIISSFFMLCLGIFGDHGLIKYFAYKKALENNYNNLSELQLQVVKTKNKINLLAGEKVDKDFLDEKARDVLTLQEEKELILVQE